MKGSIEIIFSYNFQSHQRSCRKLVRISYSLIHQEEFRIRVLSDANPTNVKFFITPQLFN